MAEQFALRWNDFQSNLLSSFNALLANEEMVDVTLAAGGQYVHAHKLILSISSPYFKEIFKANPCDHPIVILKDVSHQELCHLLQYMYRGEVHVNRQELSDLLHTAEMLKIKGLSGERERSSSPEPQLAPSPAGTGAAADMADAPEWVPGGEDTIATEATPDKHPPRDQLSQTTNKRLLTVKKEPRSASESPHRPEVPEYSSDGEPLVDVDNDLFHSILMPDAVKEPGWSCKNKLLKGVKCPSCHRFFANRYNLKVHIRDKHDTREGTLQCDICHKFMRNPSCLRVHMYHHRKQAAYLAQQRQADIIRKSMPNMIKLEDESKWSIKGSPSTGDVNHEAELPEPMVEQGVWSSEAALPAGDNADNCPVKMEEA